MSVDLRLLPMESSRCIDGRVTGWTHTVLELGRVRSAAWDALYRDVRAYLAPVSEEVTSWVGGRVPSGPNEGERCYGYLTKDAYGDRYFAVQAQHIVAWLETYFRDEPLGFAHRAAATAFVRALSPETWIILDWH